MNIIPESFRVVLIDEMRTFSYPATLKADGSPQVTPAWFKTDGNTILLAGKYFGIFNIKHRVLGTKKVIYTILPLRTDAHG